MRPWWLSPSGTATTCLIAIPCFFAKRIAFIMSWYAHHQRRRRKSSRHSYHPHFDLFASQRMGNSKSVGTPSFSLVAGFCFSGATGFCTLQKAANLVLFLQPQSLKRMPAATAQAIAHDCVGTGREQYILPSCTKAPDSSLMSWLNTKNTFMVHQSSCAAPKYAPDLASHQSWSMLDNNSSAYCVMPK